MIWRSCYEENINVIVTQKKCVYFCQFDINKEFDHIGKHLEKICWTFYSNIYRISNFARYYLRTKLIISMSLVNKSFLELLKNLIRCYMLVDLTVRKLFSKFSPMLFFNWKIRLTFFEEGKRKYAFGIIPSEKINNLFNI